MTDPNPNHEINRTHISKISQASSSSTTSSTTTWSRFKDPRIVRVSRAFGGKDRHSKVVTVRGLRDRRVRLSVPTAIQLYDLQDRLGLNQPSKVIDWLLNVAKHDIDELPPLQIPPEKQQIMKFGEECNRFNDPFKNPVSNFFQGKFNDTREEENQGSSSVPGSSFFPGADHRNLLNNGIGSNNWDLSNLTLSHPPRENLYNFNLLQLPQAFSTVPSGSQPVLVYHQPGITQSYFPSGVNPYLVSKEINFRSLLSQVQESTPPVPVRSFGFSMTENLFRTQDDSRNDQNN